MYIKANAGGYCTVIILNLKLFSFILRSCKHDTTIFTSYRSDIEKSQLISAITHDNGYIRRSVTDSSLHQRADPGSKRLVFSSGRPLQY